MKVVYVITRADVIGGANVHLLDLAIGLQSAGHEVVILAGGNGVFTQRAINCGIKCISLKYIAREVKLITDFLGFFELRNKFTELKPDIVHLHSSKAGILGRLAAKATGVPAVFTAHGWAFTEGVSKNKRILYRFIESCMAHFASKIITVSEYDRQLAISSKVGNVKLITTIHNGVPDVNIKRGFDTLEGPVKMVMVARFDDQKDQKLLIKSLSKLKDLSWEMLMIGDGPLLKDAQLYADSLGLINRIVFLGACDDVVSYLAKADVFLLVSNWEGLPLAILEAMRAELPVIASKVGGVPEAVVDGGTGFIIDREDADGLASAMAKLINSADLRKQMGAAGYKKFKEQFTFSVMLEKTINIYCDVIHRKQ